MARINRNYEKLPGSYLFSEIARRTAAYQEANPDARLIKWASATSPARSPRPSSPPCTPP